MFYCHIPSSIGGGNNHNLVTIFGFCLLPSSALNSTDLVGVRTRQNIPYGSSDSFCSTGSTKAAVFPLPVLAQPIQSRPKRTWSILYHKLFVVQQFSRAEPKCFYKRSCMSAVYKILMWHQYFVMFTWATHDSNLPCRIAGTQFSWTGVGFWIPSCLHCLTSQSDSPSDEKSDILCKCRSQKLHKDLSILFNPKKTAKGPFYVSLNILVEKLGCRGLIA